MTVCAVAAGSGALTAALILGASVQRAVDDGIEVEYAGIDIIQTSDQASEDAAGGTGSGTSAIDRRYLRAIDRIEGVELLGTMIRTSAVVQVGEQTRGISIESLNSQTAFRWQGLSSGSYPEGPGEVALSEQTLDRLGVALGDAVALGRPAVGRFLFSVVGVLDTRGSIERQSSLYGVVDRDVAAALAGIDGPNTLTARVGQGYDVELVVDEINTVAPIGLPQSTTDVVAGRRAIQLAQIQAMSTVVAGLAGISCLVAAVISATTTGASLASRRRTWALARCVGAGRRHVAGLVTAEALLLGIFGSALGVLGGLGLSRAALPLLDLVPTLPPIPPNAFTVTPVSILLPVLLPVSLALLASMVPAYLAARIPPSAALVATVAPPRPRSGAKAITAVGSFVAGSALAFHAAGSGSEGLVVGGVALLILGALGSLGPALLWSARAGAVGARSIATRIGLLDVVRRPRAAVIEALAVFLAVAMISLSWVALSSIEAATSARLNASPLPDLTVGAANGSAPVMPDTVERLREVEGVREVVPIPFGREVVAHGRGTDGDVTLSVGTAGGEAQSLGAVLPDGFPVPQVSNDAIYLPVSSYPPFHDGSEVSVIGPDGTARGLEVVYVEDLPLPTLVSSATLERVSQDTDFRTVWVSLLPGVDRAAVVDGVTGVTIVDGQIPVGGPVVLDIRVASGLATARAAAVAILAIAVLVAVLGAAATAALALTERGREHATLRALGLPRPALYRALATRVLHVSLTASLAGVLAGGVIGAVAARLVASTLGLDPVVSVPVLPICLVVAGTVLAVRAAALVPVEQASWVPPSRALARG